ncbi:multidrug effflux MFS transporter [Maribellus maritimus]|uniref:multidrug effflux MFS transporter n=1 Tax=Maribellus maritimus TaxID=2870838 RepID=UPI001EEB8A15|nr:multidrug effflux MFS transporter [Maribellus maritimus]MCG6188496.1 multidrug effflux MFS transporter [Maribellus maritimus]
MNEKQSPEFYKTGKGRVKIILILGILTAYVPFSIDTYLPAMTHIADYFGTTSAKMTFSLTTFFIGFATGQILYGPLLDLYGRKTPLYIGLVISILASVACIFAWDAGSFIIFRFIQALGASVASVSALAMVRDFFPPEESSGIFSMLVLVIGSSPLIAPTLGGYITAHIGWPWIFVFLSLMAVALINLVFFVLPVNYFPDKNSKLKIAVLVKDYWAILSNPQFITYALAGAFSFASLFIYVAGSPIIFMEKYHMTAQNFGVVFAMLSVGFIGGSQLNILALKKFKSQQIFQFALLCQMSIAMVFFIGILNNWYGRNTIIVFLFLILLCLGFTSPNGIALALSPIQKNLGSASALVGTIRIGIAGLTSGGIGLLNVSDGIPVAGMMLVTALISFSILVINRKRISLFSLVKQN